MELSKLLLLVVVVLLLGQFSKALDVTFFCNELQVPFLLLKSN